MKHYTSIEQSKKLLELGLNPESADMNYYYQSDVEKYIIVPIVDKPFDEDDLPCWSLGALLEVIPKEISFILSGGTNNGEKAYGATIIDGVKEDNEFIHNSSLEVAYSMVVWLLENGHIKKESDN